MSSSRTLTDHLAASPEASRVIAHAGLLLRIGRLYAAAVPDALVRVSRVANFKSGIVVIHADSGVAAAKLKQIAGRLVAALSCEGLECSGIEVRVQPPAAGPLEGKKSQRTLSPVALAAMGSARDKLAGGTKLRAALDVLLERAAR